MKKSVLVIALAMMLVFAMATVAMAKNAGSPAVAATSGFVNWPDVNTAIANGSTIMVAPGAAQLDGPHGNYTTTTIKCAVCHSTHGAPAGSFLLTKATGVVAGSAGATCSYCHARTATASTKKVSLVMGQSTDPHASRCTGNTACHAESPHGVGVSTYTLMATKLINKDVDVPIAAAIADSANTGLVAADFAIGAPNDFKVVTGYVCAQAGCHNYSAFAVTDRGDQMMTSATGAVKKTGHPVVAAANAVFTPPAGSSVTTQVAWKPTNGCDTCHDVADAGNGGLSWFPHNTPDKELVGQGANLWMTTSANAATPPTNLSSAWIVDGDYGAVTDGNCIKCHVADVAKTAGVGISY